MNLYTIYLRNGTQIPVECDEFSITRSNISGKIYGYSCQNVIYNVPIFLDTDEIVAIIKNRNEEDNNA